MNQDASLINCGLGKVSTVLDINQIKEVLPHRYPFLLLDRVVEVEEAVSLRAIKNVTANEPFFEGHFEHKPVFPGVLMIECIAQASAVLASLMLGARADSKNLYLFAGVDKARFKRIVEPGDQMDITAELIGRKKDLWRCRGRICVNGEMACSCEVLFTHREIR